MLVLANNTLVLIQEAPTVTLNNRKVSRNLIKTVITAHYSLTAATDGGASGGLGGQEVSQQYPLVQCGAFDSFMIDYSLCLVRII